MIGVVTSPTGAVIQDILHRLRDRFGVHVLVWPVLVQGQGSAEQVADAITGFNALDKTSSLPRPDLLIIARGGGAIEDLMSFNEEIVVRAAFASQIPLISSIGHETDTTLLDFVADKRAPTPTAAAEMATPVMAELAAKVADWQARMMGAMARRLSDASQQLSGLSRGLTHPVEKLNAQAQSLDFAHNKLIRQTEQRLFSAETKLNQLAMRLVPPHQQLAKMARRYDQNAEKLTPALKAIWERKSALFSQNVRLLDANSFTKVLERGFVLVKDDTGKALKSASQAATGAEVSLVFHDGAKQAQIIGNDDASMPPRPKPKTARSKPKPSANGQEELF